MTPRRKLISERASLSEVNQLVDWIISKRGRQAELARQLGVAAPVVGKVQNTGTCTKDMFYRLKKAQEAVIKKEKQHEND